jgi:hypothetical protein
MKKALYISAFQVYNTFDNYSTGKMDKDYQSNLLDRGYKDIESKAALIFLLSYQNSLV